MGELKEWFGLAQSLGAGATAVMGICLWWIVGQWASDRRYSRERDEKTLAVLAQLADSMKNTTTAENRTAEKILEYQGRIEASIAELKRTITDHLLRGGVNSGGGSHA